VKALDPFLFLMKSIAITLVFPAVVKTAWTWAFPSPETGSGRAIQGYAALRPSCVRLPLTVPNAGFMCNLVFAKNNDVDD
jgi:hypothetical protein